MPALTAVRRRRLQIDFTPVHCVVVAIGITRGTSQSAHATRAGGRRIGTHRTRIAAHPAIVDRVRVDFAAIARLHVAIRITRKARFDRTRPIGATFVRIRQVANKIAEPAILHGLDRRLTTVREIAVAISCTRTAGIVLA